MNKGKKSLIALLIIFTAPVILGTLVFFNKERLGLGGSTVNYGTLVTPPIPLNINDLMLANQQAKKEQTITKKWTLLYIAPNECDAFCQDRILLMKRVRLLMNEEMRRIRTVLVSTDKTLEQNLKNDYPDFIFAQIESATSPFLKQFSQQDRKPVYMIDPLGNLMMLYPQEKPNHKLMIKDLKRLLKYSRIG